MTKQKIPEKHPIGARIATRRKEIKMSQTKLADLVGMTQTGIADIESGGVKRPGKLLEIATALRTTQQWLLEAAGPRALDEIGSALGHINPRERINEAQPKRSKTLLGVEEELRLYSTARVPEIEVLAGASYAGGFNQEENTIDGNGNSITTDAIRANWGIPLPFLRDELHIRPGRAHILQVRGDSMTDALFDGDRALIDLDDVDVSQGGIFALLDDNSSVIIKQVELIRSQSGPRRIKCTSRNPVYDPFELILADHVKIIGRVASKITRL